MPKLAPTLIQPNVVADAMFAVNVPSDSIPKSGPTFIQPNVVADAIGNVAIFADISLLAEMAMPAPAV